MYLIRIPRPKIVVVLVVAISTAIVIQLLSWHAFKMAGVTNIDDRMPRNVEHSQYPAWHGNSLQSFSNIKRSIPRKSASVPKTVIDKPAFDLMGFKGTEMPFMHVHSDYTSLYPDPMNPSTDRIMTQLSYVPRMRPKSVKKIVISRVFDKNIKMGRKTFLDLKCKVSQCTLTKNVHEIATADLVIVTEITHTRAYIDALKKTPRVPGQIWAYYNTESTVRFDNTLGSFNFNWTISFTPSSTVPDLYGYLYPKQRDVTTHPQTKNFAKGKLGRALWFVTNCENVPNKRMDYVKELSKYIQIDIYGKCGTHHECPRSEYLNDCMINMISRYKFYLAFENSNCETYITEKFFLTSLGNEILPVVMGAPPSYYARVAPPHSYLHVEQFPSPRHLADHLHKLDRNDTLYNEYFQWKGAWRYIPGRAWLCRLCAMLHAPKITTVNTVDKWRESDKCREPVFRSNTQR